MKRIISVVMLVAVLMGAFSVCAFADAKADIVAKAKDVCPDGFEDQYIPALENILAQIDVTDAQAAIAIEAMENSKAIVNSGKGTKLDDYTVAEKDAVLADLKKGCDALAIGYEVYDNDKVTTVRFFKLADNKVLGEVTIGEKVVEGTGIQVSAPATMLIVAAVALVALAGAAYVCKKDRA